MVFHFRKGNFNLKDKLKEGHPRGLDSDDLKAAVEANLIITVREFRRHFRVSHIIICHVMKIFWNVSRVGKWVTYDLAIENHKECVGYCALLPTCQLQTLFWEVTESLMRSRSFITMLSWRYQWLSHKGKPAQQLRAGLHPRKILLSVLCIV